MLDLTFENKAPFVSKALGITGVSTVSIFSGEIISRVTVAEVYGSAAIVMGILIFAVKEEKDYSNEQNQ